MYLHLKVWDMTRTVTLIAVLFILIEHLRDQPTVASSTGPQQALIGGIAYGGYARKVLFLLL